MLLVGSVASFAQQEVNIYNAESIQKYLKERIADTKARQKSARDSLKAVDKEMRTLQRDLEKSRAQAVKDRQRVKAAQKSGKFYQPKPYVPAELKKVNVEDSLSKMSKEERTKIEAEKKQQVQAAKNQAKQQAEKAKIMSKTGGAREKAELRASARQQKQRRKEKAAEDKLKAKAAKAEAKNAEAEEPKTEAEEAKEAEEAVEAVEKPEKPEVEAPKEEKEEKVEQPENPKEESQKEEEPAKTRSLQYN